MAELSIEEEKDAVDFITNCMFSTDFLREISDVIFSNNRDKITVGEFYDRWLAASGARDVKVPFNPGVILGYLYCGILYPKENWFDLLSEEPLDTANADWGIGGVKCVSPKQPRPTIRYVVKRIRNSLGHGTLTIKVPPDLESPNDILKLVTFRFYDENIRDKSDTFEIVLSIDQSSKLVKKFQSIVHKHVRSKL